PMGLSPWRSASSAAVTPSNGDAGGDVTLTRRPPRGSRDAWLWSTAPSQVTGADAASAHAGPAADRYCGRGRRAPGPAIRWARPHPTLPDIEENPWLDPVTPSDPWSTASAGPATLRARPWHPPPARSGRCCPW